MKKLLKSQAKSLALTTILLLSIANTLSAQKVAIIDAGSSGSRLYVYEIEKSSGDFTILYPSPEQEANSKGRALSSIANHSDSVRVFLSTMTSKYNRKDTVGQIPLYILATAGMRMLPKAKVDSIYEKINNQTAELNGFRLDTAMTISGRYEGFYANSLPRNDSEKNYHPWINARYITWVIESLNLDEKLVILKTKSDWTEGAALDILVNQKKPEGFDYEKVN